MLFRPLHDVNAFGKQPFIHIAYHKDFRANFLITFMKRIIFNEKESVAFVFEYLHDDLSYNYTY